MYFLDLTSFQEARRNRLELANHSISKLMNLYELIDIQNMLRKNHIFNDVTNYLKVMGLLHSEKEGNRCDSHTCKRIHIPLTIEKI